MTVVKHTHICKLYLKYLPQFQQKDQRVMKMHSQDMQHSQQGPLHLSILNNYISLFFGTFVALNPDKKKKIEKKSIPSGELDICLPP